MTSRRSGGTMPEKRSVMSRLTVSTLRSSPPQRSSRQPRPWLFGEKGRSVRKSEHSVARRIHLTVCEVDVADGIGAAKEVRSATHQQDFGNPLQRHQDQREKSTWPRASREAIGNPRSRKKTKSRQLPRLQVRRPLDGSRQSAPAKRNSRIRRPFRPERRLMRIDGHDLVGQARVKKAICENRYCAE